MAVQTSSPGYTSAQTISVLTGASLMLTMSMGMRQSFGLFVAPVTQDLGISVADFTLAIAIQNFTWGLTQPLIGAFADRFGCRIMCILGSLLYAAGLGVTMMAEGPIALWIGLGVMVGLALACTGLSLALAASARAVSAVKRSVTPRNHISGRVHRDLHFRTARTRTYRQRTGWLMAMVGFLGPLRGHDSRRVFSPALGIKPNSKMAKASYRHRGEHTTEESSDRGMAT